MWGRKQTPVETAHVPTDAEYWAKRDAERKDWEAQQKQRDIESGWDGYPPQTLNLSTTELAALYNYELSAYNDTVGYYADGIQRVSPLPRRK